MSVEEMPVLTISYTRENIAEAIGADNVEKWLHHNEKAFIDTIHDMFYDLVWNLHHYY